MGAASLIASAFGIILLILAAYFLAAGAVSTIEVVSSAQKDMTQLQVEMLGTSIEILEYSNTTTDAIIYTRNTGKEPIRDYQHMDVYILNQTGWTQFHYNTGPNSWIHNLTGTWNPGKDLRIIATPFGEPPVAVKIVTPNGVSALL